MEDSRRHGVLKLEELIRNYINLEDNSIAKAELTNMILEGEDLIDALDILDFETEEEMKEYKKAKSDYEEKCQEYTKLEEEHEELKKRYEKLEEDYNKNLTQDIEKLIEGKECPFINKLKELIIYSKETLD